MAKTNKNTPMFYNAPPEKRTRQTDIEKKLHESITSITLLILILTGRHECVTSRSGNGYFDASMFVFELAVIAMYWIYFGNLTNDSYAIHFLLIHFFSKFARRKHPQNTNT